MSAQQRFDGKWRIVSTECWDEESLDMVGQAHIRFDSSGLRGQFLCGTDQGDMDCRFGERDGKSLVEFSWEGFTDTDQACGRGWAVVGEGDMLNGRLYCHFGEEYGFRASKRSR